MQQTPKNIQVRTRNFARSLTKFIINEPYVPRVLLCEKSRRKIEEINVIRKHSLIFTITYDVNAI